MKKFLALILVLLVTLSMVACGRDSGDSSDEGLVDGEGKTIGFVISTQTNPFFVALKDGAEAVANDLGVQLIVLDSQDDSARAASNMEDLITRGVDLIIVNPTDSDAIVNSVLAANEAGIPVITVDRASNGGEILTHIASDNMAGGKMAGEFIIEQLAGEGKLVELEGIAGTNAARERGEGFNLVVGDSNLEVVARQTADFDRVRGLEVMENILQSQEDIQAVFAHNDEMALGALEAIKASGRDILVVGFDATDDAVLAVQAGDLAATVAQQPVLMGEMAIENAVKFLDGESIESSIPVDLKLIVE